MDDRQDSTRAAAGHRGLAELWQIDAGAPVPDGRVHPGRVARGWPIQEGGVHRESKPFAVDTRRGRTTRNAGN